jgi:hypothetical protein
VNAFELIATIIACFFIAGVVVGLLIVAAIPGIARLLASRSYREQWPLIDPKDKLDIGPPLTGTDYQEPDDRDITPGRPWWQGTDQNN